QSLHHAEQGRELWIALVAQSAVKRFAGDTGIAGNAGHAACAGDDAESIGDECRIASLKGFGKELGLGLLVAEIFGGIEGQRFKSHIKSPSPSALPWRCRGPENPYRHHRAARSA